MSSPGNSHESTPAETPRLGGPRSPGLPESSLRIAHELANLVDGGLRNLSMVISGFESSAPTDSGVNTRQSGTVLERLTVTNQAMKQMAELLHRWMHQTQPREGLHRVSWTLGQTVEQAVRLLSPAASSRGINLRVCLSQEAAELPAGPVYPVIANALRNSIEAISNSPPTGSAEPNEVELVGQLRNGTVELTIRDNGPGIDASLMDDAGDFQFGRTTKPESQGVGLALSRDIADSLGGGIGLTNRSDRGVELVLRYPAESVSHGVKPGSSPPA